MSEAMTGATLLSPNDASAIGHKVVEMADRLKATAPALPGVQAEWTFKMDGDEYSVIIRRETQP